MIGVGVLFFTICGLFYYYYTTTQSKLAEMAEIQGQLKMSIEVQNNSIKTMKDDFDRQSQSSEILGKRIIEIEKQTSGLAELLSRHDLGYLASQKPGLIENRVNRGTRDVLDQLRRLTDPENFE